MSLANEVRYTARSITPPGADRDSESPPPKRRAALSKSPPLPPPPPFPPKGAVRIISSRSPSTRRSTSRSPPPKRRGRSRSPSPKKRGRSRSPSPKKRGRSRSPSPKKRGRSRSPSPKKRGRSRSPSPKRRGRSRSRSRNRSRSRSRDEQRNPGNNLYVTGLSTRTSSSDLEKFFSKEGKVQDCHIVIDPRSKESRGFAFVTMENVEDARRCIRQREPVRGHLLLENTVVQEVGVLDIRLSGPAGGPAGVRKTARGRLVEGTETGSATETKSGSQQVANHWELV